MATLSSLVVDIRTNTAKFTQGMNKAQKRLRRFAGTVKKTSQALGGLFKRVAVGGLIGGGIFAVLIKQSLNAIDNIGKLSKTYGIATQDLAAFQLAAELGGSSLETFAKASRNVSVAVFDFLVRGTGLAVDAFRQLGITQKDLAPIQNDSVEVMGLIADRLNAMEAGAIKTAVQIKLFGGRAAEIVPALEGGAAQLRKFKEEAILFGTALDTSAVAGVEAANDSITRLGFVFKGARDQITAALAPALELLVTRIRETILEAAKSQGGIEKFAQGIARNIIDIFIKAVRGIEALSDKVKDVLGDFDIGGDEGQSSIGKRIDKKLESINRLILEGDVAARKVAEIDAKIQAGTVGFGEALTIPFQRSTVTRIKERINNLKDETQALLDLYANASPDTGGGFVELLEELKNSIGKVTEGTGSLTKGLGGSSDAINNNSDAIKKQIDALTIQAGTLGATADQMVLIKLAADGATGAQLLMAESSLKSIAAFKEEQDQIEKTKAIVLSIQTPLQKFEQQVMDLNDALAFGTLTYDQYNLAIKKYQDELDKAGEKTDELGEFAKKAAQNIQDELGDTLLNILNGKFDNIGSSFDQLIKKMIAQAAAAKIGELLFPNLNKEGGGSGNSFFDKLIGGFSNLIPGFANGTSFAPGGLAVVGEQGPELVNLPRGSQVIPNGTSMGMTVVNNFTVSGQTDSRSQQQIADAAFRGVTRANQRNG